jgi:hypothetical protein
MPEVEAAHIEEIDVELQTESDQQDEGVLDATDTYVEGVDDEA